ncbi:MAG TPA: outer membrane protein assembly factor BamD [Lacipirellulaceae bacterium]|nr:outer membrane protein assembly factor BamD [Lacipirellulaceae bacterium]
MTPHGRAPYCSPALVEYLRRVGDIPCALAASQRAYVRMTLPKSFAAIVAILLLACGCASLQLPSMAAGDPKQPGSPAWWKRHKSKAVMVPGQGYQVAGVDGFFDWEGRPINARVQKIVDHSPKGGGLLAENEFIDTVKKVKERVGMGPDQQEAERQFQMGEVNFRAKRYDEAAKNFKAAAAGWPDSALAQDALFQLAESLFFAERYPKAIDAYGRLLRDYPNSPHLDKSITRQFAIARYWEQYAEYDPDWVITPNLVKKSLPLFDTLGRAIKVYENIRLNDPTGPLADDAIMATANSYFRRGRYEDADYQYDLLRKEYPRSEHQYNAHVLELQCKLRKYQGPDYDGTPLEEAKQLVRQQRVQFSGELDAEQKQRLAQIDAELTRALAEREYAMAEHFDKIEQYASAKFYYNEVVKNYPSTPLAATARDRILALGGEPDQPEPKLAWLINLVPESDERLAVKQVPLVESTDAPRLAEQGSGSSTQQGDSSGPTLRR